MPSLYGSRDILSRRNSGYKSSVNALAEIVDNSIDAGATKITIELLEGPLRDQNQTTRKLQEIRVVDNGHGMAPEALNKCLAFGDGDEYQRGRIGRFGYGLPNSSISVGRRVDVKSKTASQPWHHTYLDIDEIQQLATPSFPEATQIPAPTGQETLENGTVITWSHLDRCDAATARTFSKRCKALLGRIYRYKIDKGEIELNLLIKQIDNKTHDSTERIELNDPLFLSTKLSPITPILHNAAKTDDFNPDVSSREPYWNAKTHYGKFVDTDKPNEQKPIFRRSDSFWDLKKNIRVGDDCYSFTIRASHASASITNPGRYKGGGTTVGRYLGQKMSGTEHLPSANIFWIREGRELDFGSFNLYTVTNEKNRFWTVEIHFDNSLDEILGVSNTKQSVSFRAIAEPTNAPQHGVNFMHAQEQVFHEITMQVKQCIADMMRTINGYMKAHKLKESAQDNEDPDNNNDVVPTPSGPIILSVPPDQRDWTSEQKTDVIDYLKKKHAHLNRDAIKEQVEKTAAGQTQSIVLYVPTDSGKMFDIVPARGKTVIAFNSNHEFFKRILEPLKSQKLLYPFTVAIEMFISSFAFRQSIIQIQYSERNPEYVQHAERYVDESSTLLKEFLLEQNVSINPDFIVELKKIFIDDIDD